MGMIEMGNLLILKSLFHKWKVLRDKLVMRWEKKITKIEIAKEMLFLIKNKLKKLKYVKYYLFNFNKFSLENNLIKRDEKNELLLIPELDKKNK